LQFITLNDTNKTHSVGLLWTSDQSDAETSTYQHTTPTKDKHTCSWLDSNPHSHKSSCRRATT